MKFYEKEYENYYTSEIELAKCKTHLIGNLAGCEFKEYAGYFKDVVNGQQVALFDNWVKFEWLRSRFVYNGKKYFNPVNKKYFSGCRIGCQSAFEGLFKLYLNEDLKFITRNFYFVGVRTYFEDFFPDFYNRNPYKEKLEYPYQYMSFSSLLLVLNMVNRMEFLKHGEEEQMTYSEFMDFMINHIKCHNDEVGYTHYDIYWNNTKLPVIKKNKEK